MPLRASHAILCMIRTNVPCAFIQTTWSPSLYDPFGGFRCFDSHWRHFDAIGRLESSGETHHLPNEELELVNAKNKVDKSTTTFSV